ncbi:type VI secretion system baseplate subunit TssF [Candidatus Binatia bacterium]|nr:type VI secretion system baseplate subunit TssF [Candidatus Binatia bacterium]
MADELLPYYERELAFLRQMGAEFAAKYPKIAARLQLESDRAEDPHVERMIQAAALLAARVHHKLDDEFPEITESLLNVVYPQYLAPVPSMAIAQFVLDPEQGKLTAGHRIERGTTLLSPAVDGQTCRFRTAYPVTLWPLEIAAAQLDTTARFGLTARAAGAIRLEFACLGEGSIADLQIDRLRLFLHGESRLAYGLYELLFNHAQEVILRGLRGGARTPTIVRLPPDVLRPAGLDDDENVLPVTHRSFAGYRLLQEYFALPEKFLFADLLHLDRAVTAGFAQRFEVLVLLDKLPRFEQPVTADTFRLGCTPVVNLFEQLAEPIRLSHTRTEYRVIADVHRQQSTEVYSVDRVGSSRPDGQEVVEIYPFYSLRHAGTAEREGAYWYATRRASERRGDTGTEVYLSLVDTGFRPTLPAAETLAVATTCTNRDLPGRLPFGGGRSDLEMEAAAPLSRIHCLLKPRETQRPPLRSAAQWRLISHLALNYLSIADGPQALQEILKLYDFSGSAVIQQQIAGLVGLSSRRVVARPGSMPWNGFCRGIEVTLEFDEDRYVGSGVFLFAAVLERFLGLYASLNSFVQLVAFTRQREEALHRWPPRAGHQILL